MIKLNQERKRVLLYVGCVLVLLCGVLLIRTFAARSELCLVMLNQLTPYFISNQSIARNLEQEAGSLVYSSLDILEDRKYRGAQHKGRELLRSEDPYTWLNAALYLAAREDACSVPYLIRGLRHPACRAHDELVSYLQKLTGEKYPKDFESWQEWWIETHPESNFDFDNHLKR